MKIDDVVRIREVQIKVNGEEQTALAAYWMMDDVNCCRIGFLPCNLVKHSKRYQGKLAQITELLETSEFHENRCFSSRNGDACKATIINSPTPEKAKYAIAKLPLENPMIRSM